MTALRPLIVTLLLPLMAVVGAALASEPSHGIAYFGNLKYPKDMTHFPYANPDAPKEGRISTWLPGSFNNLHPYKEGITVAVGMTYARPASTSDRLTKGSEDELSSVYCLLCETVEVADDYAWVAYTLREGARWHDGVPVTVDDASYGLSTQ